MVVALLSGVVAVDPAALANLPWRGLAPPSSPSPAPPPVVSETPTVSSVAPTPGPVLQQAGDVPRSGPGQFVFVDSRGAVMGTAGTLRRFQVGIEKGVDEDLAAVAAKIDQSLGDPRGWTASRQLRLQRVSPAEPTDFTIYLATAETTRRMCAEGNVDTLVDGKSYTSCRAPGRVILNLDRWRLSVPDYVGNQVPLETYREYLINHEVGHELGHGHELCPGPGRPAPVMQQQTLGLRGCTANAWPYLNGKRYAGAPTTANAPG